MADDHDANSLSNQIVRKMAPYVNESSRFLFQGLRKFSRQYSHIYAQRLVSCQPRLLKNAQKKWGSDIPCRKLFELVADERCFVIGTLYKEMKLKPNILADITDPKLIDKNTFSSFTKLTSPGDSLILEDELQRINLIGDALKVQEHVTGVVLAVLGREPENRRGWFIVEDVVYMNSYTSPPPQLDPVDDSDKWIAVVSGLGMGGKEENPLRLQMLVDSLIGLLGSPDFQMQMSKVVRLVVAGNCLSDETNEKYKMAIQARYLSRKLLAGSVTSVSKLDSLLVQLTSRMPVCIMPGQNDPSMILMPQQPLHQLMFPEASQYSTFESVTNPFFMRIDGRLILCTSGQDMDQLYKYSDIDPVLERMERILTWGHLAPTCPDTYCCYPFHDKDPFILTEEDGFSTPQIFLSSNQSEFQWKIVGEGNGRTLLVSVPMFHNSGTCVLLNPYTYECRSFQVAASILGEEYFTEEANAGTLTGGTLNLVKAN